MKPIAWRVRYRQHGFDCARLFDNEGEALHHVRHLRLRNEVSIIYGIQRLGLIDEISAAGHLQKPMVERECFWPRCSNHKRCDEHGSCVAKAQAGGRSFPPEAVSVRGKAE